MTRCGLNALYGDLAAALPTDLVDSPKFVLDPATLPRTPRELETDAVVIRTAVWPLDHGLIDVIEISARRPTIRQLGLLVMASVFLPGGDHIDLRLVHPASIVRLLRLEAWPDGEFGLETAADAFHYWVEQPGLHPWQDEGHRDPGDLPRAVVTWSDPAGNCRPFDGRDERDVVEGFGSRVGAARFAELLLNAGNPENPDDEYQLEGDGGFRGVAPNSALIRLWLPGSIGWGP